MATNYLSLRSSAAPSITAVNLTISTLTGSTITGSTINAFSNANAKSLAYSTLQGSSITTSTMTGSTIVVSSLLQISSSGLLGIGTNPTQALHVQGSTIVSGAIGIGTTNPIANLVVYNGTASGMLPYINISGGGTVGAMNKVGINISPWSQEAGRAGGPETQIAAIDDGIGSAHMLFATAVNNTTYGSGNGLGALVERMRITSAGNVGIGTISPSQALSVIGSIYSYNGTFLVNNTGTYQTIGVQINNTNSSTVIQLSVSGTTGWGSTGTFGIYNGCGINAGFPLNILPNGNVGIGTTNPGQSLDVYGTIARNSLKLPRVDYGTLSAATSVSIPILFSDSQYSMVEIRFRYTVSAVCVLNMSATSTTPTAMVMEECGLTISQYNSPASPFYYNVAYNSGATSFILANAVEVSFDNNLMFRIVRAVGGNRNHYCLDNIYCWSGIGTARGYGQGHINNTSTGGPAIASINFTCSVGNINGTWSTTHYN